MIKTLCGENDSERLRAVRQFVTAYEAEHGDMAVERLDAEEASYDRMAEVASSAAFLCDRKLVVLRGASLNKDFAARFEEFLGSVADATDVLFVEGKLDKRTSYYKQLQKLTDFTEFKILDAQGLVRHAAEYAREQGGMLSMGDARLLVERVGLNQLSVQHEIEKLLLYDPKISRGTIELLTDRLPQSRVFDLLDAAFSGNTVRMQQLYADQRAQGVEPQQIIAMLVWQLYIFALVKAGQGKSAGDIAREAKISPFAVEKAQSAMRRVSLAELRAMIRSLRELDVRSKTEGIIVDEALQYYLLALAT